MAGRPGRARLVLLLGAGLLLAGCRVSGGDGRAGFDPSLYPPWNGPLPRPSGPVWLIGVDGATWDVMRPMLARGLLPNFAALLEGGAHGTLLSEEPTISPALWATIATGVPRAAHGVDNFTVKLPASYGEVEAGPLDRRAPALWDLVGAAGGRSIVVGWFGSHPAEEIAGAYVSKGLDPQKPQPSQVHPDALVEWLPAQAVVLLPRFAVEQIARTNFLRERLIEDARAMAVLEALVKREPADLVAAYFSGIDVAQHVTWKHMDPSYEPFAGEGPRIEELADVIFAYYRFVDHLLGRIRALAPENATLVVVSDHGGGPMLPEQAYHFQLDVLLRALGYTTMRRDDPRAIDPQRSIAFTISELYRDDKRIWLNLAGVEPEGIVEPGRARETAEDIARRLQALRTDSKDPLFESVIVHTRRDDWRPGDPALAVRFSREALPAVTATDGEDTFDMAPVRLRHADVSGGHRRDGIFIASGPGVVAGAIERSMNLYQVAPTVLYLLGLPQDRRMLEHAPAGGGVAELLIAGEVLRARPVYAAAEFRGARWHAGSRRGEVGEADPAAEESLAGLRALGYVR